jgi:DNA gyrase subunit B
LKVYNTTTKDLSDIIEHQEIKDILTILGCGIGDKFNIDNLRYDKIIIATDADIDGFHIELLLMSLFLFHLPELVKQGKIYTTQAPLYKVTNNRGVKYYYSDAEVRGKVGDIVHLKGLGEMNPQELYDTTLNPENRKLIQLKPENIEELQALYTTLMGNSSAERQKFILSHKISKYSGDTFVEEE